MCFGTFFFHEKDLTGKTSPTEGLCGTINSESEFFMILQAAKWIENKGRTL